MYKSSSLVGVAATLLALSWSSAGVAQGNCGNIEFGPEITNQFPNARNACLGIVQRGNEQFARFEARIRNVRGSQVEAEFRQADGTWGQPVTFTPPADARIRIDNRSYRFRDLSRGQELNVYLPPDRWALAVAQDDQEFEVAQQITVVELEEPSPQVAAALPRTASPLPLLALLGGLLTALGGAVAGLRYGLRRKA
jgi:hypothetical protein